MTEQRAMSEEKLADLRRTMTGHVDAGEMPGLVYLVAHGDDVEVQAIGQLSFEDTTPMATDSLFRIASLSKPVAGVAAMILVDDGVLAIGDPVDDLLPELANPRVLRTLESEIDDTVPANRPITVEDVLTSRLGTGALLAMPGTYPIQAIDADLELATFGPPWPPSPLSPDEWIVGLGSAPLMYQPGEHWTYNTSIQVLGVLIERASGQPILEFLQERIFEPLGMIDTGFVPTAEQLSRMTTAYEPDFETGELSVLDDVAHSMWLDPKVMPNMAGWLLSTMDDYGRFVQMVRRGGAADGVRVLSEEAVRRMTTDHLTAAQRAEAELFVGVNCGWGYAMGAPANDGSVPSDPAVLGGFGWDGGSGTSWRTDPRRDLTGILLTQRAMGSPEPPAAFRAFWTAVPDLRSA